MLRFGVPGSLPIPDGAETAQDRAIGLGWYSGIGAGVFPNYPVDDRFRILVHVDASRVVIQ